ncbi:MAG TPA: hypothetical protein IAC86_05935 [Candidatus Cryptobacteroides excrementigallinarum]|nr:hypothetical protein [Candidatus Cryptobacteroides excrementigallinarum]
MEAAKDGFEEIVCYFPFFIRRGKKNISMPAKETSETEECFLAFLGNHGGLPNIWEKHLNYEL